MPVCRICNKSFPNRVWIDGKRKLLHNRIHCLDCVPYGERFKLENNEINNEINFVDCICTICGREYKYHHTSSHIKTKCNSCLVNSQKEKKRKMSIEYLGGKCAICGYDKCLRALSFHHIDPSTKSFGISGNHCLSWEKIKNELDKCILLCSNCHMELEDNLFNLI